MELLIIMDEINRVCKEHGLHYYLAGGSLLGAYRHQGFIPWDDDLDITMPRYDFDNFIANADKWLSKDFSLEWITTNANYVYPFAKVTLRDTVFQDSPYTNMGIFIDIFPIDLTSRYSVYTKYEKLVIHKMTAVMWHKLKKDCFPRYWYMWLPSITLSFRNIHAIIRLVAKSAGLRGKSHFANFGSNYHIKKQTMPMEWWGEGKYMKFEDRQYIVPNCIEKVLCSIFGENYMELPPIEKRRSHYPAKVIFSNGDIMEFEYKHKVTLEDQ